MVSPAGRGALRCSEEGNYPEKTTTRQASDLLAQGFGPGFNGPLILASEVPEGTGPRIHIEAPPDLDAELAELDIEAELEAEHPGGPRPAPMPPLPSK